MQGAPARLIILHSLWINAANTACSSSTNCCLELVPLGGHYIDPKHRERRRFTSRSGKKREKKKEKTASRAPSALLLRPAQSLQIDFKRPNRWSGGSTASPPPGNLLSADARIRDNAVIRFYTLKRFVFLQSFTSFL